MTVTKRITIKRKLKGELVSGNHAAENTKRGCRRKLSQEWPAENHLPIPENTSHLQACNEAHFYSDSGRSLSSSSDSNQDSFCHTGATGLAISQHLNCSDYLCSAHMLSDERFKLNCAVKPTHRSATKGMLEHQKEKGHSMDVGRVKQCSAILKKLMTHQYGWVFNFPVDPVRLNIPDYFSIISKPMDLSTVKNKLESMQYSFTSQFVEDVELTFANAMRYNPPSNDVHIMAKKLSNVFNSGWKSLEARYEEHEFLALRKKINKKVQNSKEMIHGRAFNCQSSRKWATPIKSRDVKFACGQESAKFLLKGSERRMGSIHACSVPGSNTICKGALEDGQRDNCNVYTDGTVSILNEENSHLETYATTSTTTSGSGKGNEDQSYVEQLSPSKALRAAILKGRFAETILKAQQKTLLNHGEIGDLTKMQEDKIRLEKQQKQEKARIEAQIKAAETAARMKEAELRLKREKEREAARLAVQNMEKTVDVDENLGFLRDIHSLGYPGQLFEEMPVNFLDGVDLPGGSVNPLEQLGLFMKNEDLDEDVDEWISATGDGNTEEGEIGIASS